MKTIALFLTLSLTSISSFAGGCYQVSAHISKCSVEEARYLVDIGKCKLKPWSRNNSYDYGYFSIGEKVLVTQWLEDDHGIINGSFKKSVRDDYRTITTSKSWFSSTDAKNRCEALRDPYALMKHTRATVARLVKDFLGN